MYSNHFQKLGPSNKTIHLEKRKHSNNLCRFLIKPYVYIIQIYTCFFNYIVMDYRFLKFLLRNGVL